MYREDTLDLGDFLPVLEPIGQYSERKRFGFRDCLVPARAVNHNARQLNYFTNPAAIGLTLEIYREVAH